MKKYFSFGLLAGCAAILALGLIQLFQLRFEAGDVYPAYSSLRADPLGTMALYESLGKVAGISVRRDFSTGNRLPEEPHTVYLQLGGSVYDWDRVPADLFGELKAFLARGNRLVILLYPQTWSYDFHDENDEDTNSVKSSQAGARDKKMTRDKPATKRKNLNDEDEVVDLTERWGFEVNFVKLAQAEGSYEPARVVNKTGLPLPRSLDWHSAAVFTNLDNAWRVIYGRGTNAVIIERQFGKGSVVMATDPYFVSNEAMEKDRHADLLAWLVGSNRHIVFDESHFGIVDSSGIAMLMR